jgi:hypothetical protein
VSKCVWLAFDANSPITTLRSFDELEDARRYVNKVAVVEAGEPWRTDKNAEETLANMVGRQACVQQYGNWRVMSSKVKRKCRCKRQ